MATNQAPQGADPTASQTEAPTFGASLAGIVDRPAQTLSRIYQRPRGVWVGPLLIVLASLIVVILVSAPYTAELARAQVDQQLRGMSAAQAEQVRTAMTRLTPAVMNITAAVGGVLSVLIALLVASGVLYFAGLVLGAELNFVPLLTVMTWCWLPFALRNLAQAGVIYFQRGLIVNQGLSWLVSVGETTKDSANFIYYLLGYAEIFALWHLALVWAAARGAGKVSKTQATLIALAYAVVNIGLGWIPLIVARIFTPAAG
jgi:hypothetical protein